MSDLRKLERSLFQQIALLVLKALRGMAPMYLQDLLQLQVKTLGRYPLRSDALGLLKGSLQLVQDLCRPGICFCNSQSVKQPSSWYQREWRYWYFDRKKCRHENANLARVCFLRIPGRFWFQTLESKMLETTCCIRLARSFATFQQSPTMYNSTMLGDVGSVWPGLHGLMKRYWKYSQRHTV